VIEISLRSLCDRSKAALHSGIVERDFKASIALDHCRNKGSHLLGNGHICWNSICLATIHGDHAHRLLNLRGSASGDNDLGALTGVGKGRRPSNPTPSSCDKCDAFVEAREEGWGMFNLLDGIGGIKDRSLFPVSKIGRVPFCHRAEAGQRSA